MPKVSCVQAISKEFVEVIMLVGHLETLNARVFFFFSVSFLCFYSWFNSVLLFQSCYLEYVKRVIVHPAFKNISFKEAERLLAEMDQGECIVRPSSKVTMTISK